MAQWELDSLAGFLKIARNYYDYTQDASFINDNCEPYRAGTGLH